MHSFMMKITSLLLIILLFPTAGSSDCHNCSKRPPHSNRHGENWSQWDRNGHRNNQGRNGETSFRGHSKKDVFQSSGMESKKELKQDFYVEVTTVKNPSIIFRKNSMFAFHVGELLELICRKDPGTKTTTLQWTDNDNIKSDTYTTNSLRLRILPDIDDMNLNLTCRAEDERSHKSSISINLVVTSESSTNNSFYPKKKENSKKYLKKGQPFQNNSTCNSVTSISNDVNKIGSITSGPGAIVIDKFKAEYNGTIVFCVVYEFQNDGEGNIPTYWRRKSKATLYLQPDEETETNGNEKQMTVVAIVSGIFGVLLSLLTIFGIRYHRNRQRSLDATVPRMDSVNETVRYAIIEDRLPQLPPPRQNDSPYAKIVGTLVPKLTKPKPSSEEPYYCTIK